MLTEREVGRSCQQYHSGQCTFSAWVSSHELASAGTQTRSTLKPLMMMMMLCCCCMGKKWKRRWWKKSWLIPKSRTLLACYCCCGGYCGYCRCWRKKHGLTWLRTTTLTYQETTADTDGAELVLILLLLLLRRVNEDVQLRVGEEEAANEKVDTPSGAWSTGGEAK